LPIKQGINWSGIIVKEKKLKLKQVAKVKIWATWK
jgi:hypothetical protein